METTKKETKKKNARWGIVYFNKTEVQGFIKGRDIRKIAATFELSEQAIRRTIRQGYGKEYIVQAIFQCVAENKNKIATLTQYDV